MTSEVIVDVHPKEISIALLEDKRLVEFQKEGRSASFIVGNIYLAKVRKLMPGLNACFVNVGYERDAFLHYLDLGPKFNSYAKYLKQVSSNKKKATVNLQSCQSARSGKGRKRRALPLLAQLRGASCAGALCRRLGRASGGQAGGGPGPFRGKPELYRAARHQKRGNDHA